MNLLLDLFLHPVQVEKILRREKWRRQQESSIREREREIEELEEARHKRFQMQFGPDFVVCSYLGTSKSCDALYSEAQGLEEISRVNERLLEQEQAVLELKEMLVLEQSWSIKQHLLKSLQLELLSSSQHLALLRNQAADLEGGWSSCTSPSSGFGDMEEQSGTSEVEGRVGWEGLQEEIMKSNINDDFLLEAAAGGAVSEKTDPECGREAESRGSWGSWQRQEQDREQEQRREQGRALEQRREQGRELEQRREQDSKQVCYPGCNTRKVECYWGLASPLNKVGTLV